MHLMYRVHTFPRIPYSILLRQVHGQDDEISTFDGRINLLLHSNEIHTFLCGIMIWKMIDWKMNFILFFNGHQIELKMNILIKVVILLRNIC